MHTGPARENKSTLIRNYVETPLDDHWTKFQQAFNFRGAFCQSWEGVCKKKHQSWCRVRVGFHLRKLFATGISSHLFTPGTGNQSLQEGRDLGAMICLTRINSTERSKLGNRAAMYLHFCPGKGGKENRWKDYGRKDHDGGRAAPGGEELGVADRVIGGQGDEEGARPCC